MCGVGNITNTKTGKSASLAEALVDITGQKAPAPAPAFTLPTLPPLPQMPQMPAIQPAPTASTALAGPRASTTAPTAKQGGRPNRRRRGREGMGSLSIGSTQSAAGSGLNIGK
jgi:hypothetical protein